MSNKYLEKIAEMDKSAANLTSVISKVRASGSKLVNKAQKAFQSARSTKPMNTSRATPNAPSPAKALKPKTTKLTKAQNPTKITGLSEKAKIGLGTGATGLAVGYASGKNSDRSNKKS